MQSTTITCTVCGEIVPRRGSVQKYCRTCSEVRDLERKNLRNTPEQRRKRRSLVQQVGARVSVENRSGILWPSDEEYDPIWLTRICVPFSYALSKNHLYTMKRSGHVALRDEARAARDELIMRIREAMSSVTVARNRLWIDILVQKPNHKGDAVNVLDTVCDAIKQAVPLDDRWYSIRRLDWEIVKTDPLLYVGLSQDSDVDCMVCSFCGQIKPLDQFNKRKHSATGVDRTCRDCKKVSRKRVVQEVKHGQ